ncbi:MAG: hydrolase TatD [Cupriavidus sp.]|nr:MAG: hydrolase TatD [Cupriavidus sp.]
MIDFHCHLDLYPNGLALAREVNGRNALTFVVTTSPRAYYATSRVFSGLKNIKVGLGLHPEVAEAKAGELDALVGGIAGAPFVGEIGMDGTPRFRRTLPLQERIFQAAINECSVRGGRVLSVHSRGAERRVLELLAAQRDAGIPVMHWFSGGIADLQTAIRIGCWFSVGPAMLAGVKGKALLARMPFDRVLPETDGPFAMVSGKPLMPWDAWSICATVAEVWQQPLDEVQEQLMLNLQHLVAERTK